MERGSQGIKETALGSLRRITRFELLVLESASQS